MELPFTPIRIQETWAHIPGVSSMFSSVSFNFGHQVSNMQLAVGWLCYLGEKSALTSVGLMSPIQRWDLNACIRIRSPRDSSMQTGRKIGASSGGGASRD